MRNVVWLVGVWLLVLVGCSSQSGEDVSDAAASDQMSADASGELVVPSTDVRQGEVRDGDTASPADLVGDVPVLPTQPVDYLIVAADDFVFAAEQLRWYRESTGHSVQLEPMSGLAAGETDDEVAAERIRDWIKIHWDLRDKTRPFYVVLVGDAVESGGDWSIHVPVSYWPGLWQDCYTDNYYGDINGDHAPEIAVGRIPVATVAEFDSFMERLKAYENDTPVGPWNHRFHVYAGEGGFGEEQDKAIEMVAQKGLETVPYEFDLLFAYRSPASRYFYTPFEEVVEKMVTDGAVLVTYMGHGGGELDVPNLGSLKCRNRLPLCAFFACSTGDYPSGYDSDAEEAFRLPDGPIAMLVSTATTHPYPNAINALEMEAAVFAERAETFGEAVRRMKYRSLYETSDLREMLDSLAVLFIDREEMENSNIDHQYSYNLLGDPAIRVKLPAQGVTLQGGDAVRGQSWAFEGTVVAPTQGKVLVTIVCARASLVHKQTPVGDPEDPANQAAVQANWEAAMDHVVGEVVVDVVDGAFQGEVPVPMETSPGTYYAYAYVYNEDAKQDAAASVTIKVKSPK